MSRRPRAAVLPAVAGSALTLVLIAAGTGVAIASWTGAASADLPASSVDYIPGAPTFTAKTCTPVTATYVTGVTVNWTAVNDRATYQVLRGGAAVGPAYNGPYTTGQALSYTDGSPPGLSTSVTYSIRATANSINWTSPTATVSCP